MLKDYKKLKQERKEFLTFILNDKNNHGKTLYNFRKIDGTIYARQVLTPYFKAYLKACYQENKTKFLRTFIENYNNSGLLIQALNNRFYCDDNGTIYHNYSNML